MYCIQCGRRQRDVVYPRHNAHDTPEPTSDAYTVRYKTRVQKRS